MIPQSCFDHPVFCVAVKIVGDNPGLMAAAFAASGFLIVAAIAGWRRRR